MLGLMLMKMPRRMLIPQLNFMKPSRSSIGPTNKELNLFDDNGNLRDRQNAEGNIEAGLLLIEELGHANITKAVNKVRRTMPGLLNFFDEAKPVLSSLSGLQIDPNALKALCLAWQWRKGLVKSKKINIRNRCRENEQFCIEIATGYLQEDCEITKEHVYGQLYKIVQSSALGRTHQFHNSTLLEWIKESCHPGDSQPDNVLP